MSTRESIEADARADLAEHTRECLAGLGPCGPDCPAWDGCRECEGTGEVRRGPEIVACSACEEDQ